MATGSFSGHWISYLYLNIKCSSPAEKSLCRHKWKAGPVLFVIGQIGGLNVRELQEAITCFITAGSLLQLSKCLSVNSSRLYVQNFVLPVSATFPIREKFNSERPFSNKIPKLIGAWFYTRQLLPVMFSSMNKWCLWELVDLFRFRFYVLFILFILLPKLMIVSYYDMEKWLWRFKISELI